MVPLTIGWNFGHSLEYNDFEFGVTVYPDHKTDIYLIGLRKLKIVQVLISPVDMDILVI